MLPLKSVCTGSHSNHALSRPDTVTFPSMTDVLGSPVSCHVEGIRMRLICSQDEQKTIKVAMISLKLLNFKNNSRYLYSLLFPISLYQIFRNYRPSLCLISTKYLRIPFLRAKRKDRDRGEI